MCELIRNGEAYQSMLDGWREAKGGAIREKQRAAEAGRIAGVVNRLGATTRSSVGRSISTELAQGSKG